MSWWDNLNDTLGTLGGIWVDYNKSADPNEHKDKEHRKGKTVTGQPSLPPLLNGRSLIRNGLSLVVWCASYSLCCFLEVADDTVHYWCGGGLWSWRGMVGATKTAESSKSDIVIEGDATVKNANLTTTIVITLVVTIVASMALKKFTKT